MNKTENEIAKWEERLRLAELGPDPKFFEEALADEVVVVSQGGDLLDKKRILEAHQQGKGGKFTRVEMSDMKIIDHGMAAVVTCKGTKP